MRSPWLQTGLLLIAGAACAGPERAPFPADAFAHAAPSLAPDRQPRGPAPVRVHADGRLEFAGEASELPALLRDLERNLAEHGARAAWEAWLPAIDEALQDDQPRLELLRAGIAAERHLDELRATDAALAAALEPQIAARIAALHDALYEPPPAGDSGTYSVEEHLHFEAPVDPVVVSSAFGPRTDPFDGTRRWHFGLDLQAKQGTPVVAAAAGRVLSAGWAGGHGQRVEIDHGDGVITGYSHLSAVLVERGARVPAGQPVGLVGSTGRATGPHLHFELWRDGEAEDPLRFLDVRALEVSAR